MAKVMDKKELEEKTKEYEARLRTEMGLGSNKKEVDHFKKPYERAWTKDQKDTTTILYGGLTLAHDDLIGEAMTGLGYKMEKLPTPDNEDLTVGKEYGNRGQCNPTYYTSGNLVRYLMNLREQGVEEIEDRYVFVTAGNCGPCRFGMYEAEYRKALNEAGFGRFRVLLFQPREGFDQVEEDSALELNAKFGIALLKAFIIGDLINDLAHQIRPYEINKGETDRVIDEAKQIMGYALREKRSIFRALRKTKKLFATIQVDFTRVKPKVKITGEFWAQTTEGDGNYHMFEWLESEGAEVLSEAIGTWVEYLLFITQQSAKEELAIDASKKSLIRKISFAQKAFRLWYTMYRWALGFKTDPLPDQKLLAQYASTYYNTHLRGGEGHLEVGKTIMATKDKHAHMVLSLKPFGCMPSVMSDGVQSRVIADFTDAIFLPIETSGDGEVNVKSRVQMKLYEAKMKARAEIDEILDKHNVTIEQIRDYVAKHPKYRNAMRKYPHHHGISQAANFIAEIAPRVK